MEVGDGCVTDARSLVLVTAIIQDGDLVLLVGQERPDGTTSWIVPGGMVERFAEASGTLAFVAVSNSDVVGWCWGYHLIWPDDSSMLYLHQMEGEEAYRRKGSGAICCVRSWWQARASAPPRCSSRPVRPTSPRERVTSRWEAAWRLRGRQSTTGSSLATDVDVVPFRITTRPCVASPAVMRRALLPRE